MSNEPNAEKRAKVFQNGRSQAVRLPAEFRFSTSEVYVRRGSLPGEVILSEKPRSWDAYFEFRDSLGPIEEFPVDRDRALFDARDPFE